MVHYTKSENASLLFTFQVQDIYVCFRFFFPDEFDYVMGQLSDKVVPSWDTDLTFRLKQLDHVLAAGATQNNYPISNFAAVLSVSTSDEDESSESRKRYACPHCDKRFSHCGARNSHRRKVHERNHLCQECDIAFG